MKVLILEDDPNRIKIFKNKLKEHDVYFFTNVSDAKEATINFGPFDYYFLDHDLEGNVFVNSNYSNTGYQFAKFLAEKEVAGEIIVHSMNPAGAQNIKGVLPQAKIVPFPYLFF
jgi:hypothetical protein